MEFQPRSIALPSGPMLAPVEFKTFGRSMNTIFEATMPTRAPAIRTSSASHSGSTRVSLFSVPMNAHSGSRSASRTPAFVPRAKWRFSGSGTRVTSGNSSRTMSREPSVLALSTTTTRYVAYVWCRTDWRHCRMESRPFQFRMTTWQMPAMPPRYAPGRLEGDVDQRRADVSSGTISFFASDGIPGRGDSRGRIDGPSETKVVNAAVVDNGGVHVMEAAVCPLCGASGRVRYGELRDRSWGGARHVVVPGVCRMQSPLVGSVPHCRGDRAAVCVVLHARRGARVSPRRRRLLAQVPEGRVRGLRLPGTRA